MLIKNRRFERRPPDRDAKLILVICEGEKRERRYFQYFSEISSRLRIETIYPTTGSNNSPTGLFETAAKLTIKSASNPQPEYDLRVDDEIWFVFDTDTWGIKIDELRTNSAMQSNWFLAQSNPCFEVWLYYHFKSDFPNFQKMEISKEWKTFLPDKIVSGGFDSRQHPILMAVAAENSKNNFSSSDGKPIVGCTEVHNLAEKILPLIEPYISGKLKP